MLDGLYKRVIDRGWDPIGRVVARTGITANQITWVSVVLLGAHCAAFTWHRRPVWLLVGIIVLELLDDLDGAVARVTGTSSHDGAYLDALTDRYKELFVLCALAHVYDVWPPTLLALFGGQVTSYAKARAAMEMPISNPDWPDLFERLERIVFVCVLLVVVAALPAARSHEVMGRGLSILAVLSNASALQRAARARRLLRQRDAARRSDG